MDILINVGLLCLTVNRFYTRDMTIRGLRWDPFLEFANGVKFYFQMDGNFVIYHNGAAKVS